jgi:CheY-like chemotaxis protein
MEARRIRFSADLDPAAERVLGDPTRLQQVVWNLLSNATKFTPEGGTVHVALARAGAGQIEILVRDTGVGIAADFLPFVFERFRQADGGTRRRYGGLGLGLAIVRHIVELHGGTVGAASDGEGAGSTFRVRLPMRLDVPRPDASPVPSVPAGAALPLSRLDSVKVVVVDDERDSRELFVNVLEAAGARVRPAASAMEALQLLRAEDADVLLTDIEMPAVDGYELLRLVLADERITRSGVLPVALTAYARPADRQRALDAGFREHIAKPVDPVALVATIASVVFVNRAGVRT